MQPPHHASGTKSNPEAAFQTALAYLGIEQEEWHAYKGAGRLGPVPKSL